MNVNKIGNCGLIIHLLSQMNLANINDDSGNTFQEILCYCDDDVKEEFKSDIEKFVEQQIIKYNSKLSEEIDKTSIGE